MSIDVVYIRPEFVHGWRTACESVAAERRYLGRLTLPPFDAATSFAARLIANGWPMYCAVDAGQVVGWADIMPSDIPECVHRGTLGMGIIASHRGAGLGRRLLDACLVHAPRSGIEKVELTVFTSNTRAIALYRRAGFTDVGVIKDYRRLDGETYDALMMERFLA